MQAKKRYILVFISCAFLAYCYFGGYRLKRASHTSFSAKNSITIPLHLPSFLTAFECNGLKYIKHNKIDSRTTGTDDDDNNSDADDGGNESNHIERIAGTISSSNINFKWSADNQLHSLNLSPQLNEAKAQIPVVEMPAPIGNLPGIGKQLTDKQQQQQQKQRNRPCRMETCFDYSKCNEQFLVYVYPADSTSALGNTPPISLNYQKILSAITESRYYTADPERACLFVLGIDTLDRDSLSEDYVRNVPSRLQRLPYWNNGRNHVIFNLYSGTWPDYAENSLGFDTGEAILAKASMSVRQIRPAFDISIPLFHKQHPLRAGNTGFVTSNNFPTNKKYLLAFKGKR